MRLTTLWAVIALSTESVKRYLSKLTPESTYRGEITKLEKVSRSVDRIEKIVEALKTYSIKKANLHKASMTLEEIISETLLFCEEGIRQSGIELITPGPQSLRVYADKAQMIQVLLNLIMNSKEAILPCEVKWIKVQSGPAKRKGFVQIRVIDSGCGIGPAIAGKMMDPFFTTKEVGMGSGLGLSICQGIMKGHGGELFYEFSENHTSFVMELPFISEQ